MNILIRFFVAMLAFCIVATIAFAQQNPEGSPAEKALLPKFCIVRFKDDKQSAEAQAVIGQLGGWENFLSIHHYCYAQVFLNRAGKASNPRDAEYQRQLAVGEYGYILRAARPDFWMRPQMYVELGRIHIQRRQPEKALVLFHNAIAFNPAYLPAYMALISQLRQMGDRSAALEAASAGLQHLPGSVALKKNYLDLGGKEPFPEPITREAPAPRDVGAQTPSVTPKDEGESNAASVASESAAQLAPDAQVEAADGEAERGCRFCPPEEIQQRWRDSFGEQVEQ